MNHQPPSHVVHFERLMYLFIGIGLLRSGVDIGQSPIDVYDRAGGLIILAVWVGVTLAWIRMIVERHGNWARWLLLLLAVTSEGMTVAALLIDPRLFTSDVGVALSLIQNSVQVVAVCLIFTGNAQDWFRADTHGLRECAA